MTYNSTSKVSDMITELQGLVGINQKADLVSVIGSPALSSDDVATLISKLQTQKNTMATNLVAKGQTATGTESISSLNTKLGNIVLGKKWASGTVYTASGNTTASVSGLSFLPNIILVKETGTSSNRCLAVYWKKDSTVLINVYTDSSSSSYSGAFTDVHNGGFLTNFVSTNAGNKEWMAFE